MALTLIPPGWEVQKGLLVPKAGTVVRIRSWESMVAEFGVVGGTIQCGHGFTPSMRNLCGTIFSVKRADTSMRVKQGKDFVSIIPSVPCGAYISSHMVEPILSEIDVFLMNLQTRKVLSVQEVAPICFS